MGIMCRDEFKGYVGRGNLIPLCCEVFADTETPVSAYWKLACCGAVGSGYSFLLESVEGGENIGRYSFLGSDPRAIYTHRRGVGKLVSRDGTEREIQGRDVFEKIHNVLGAYKAVEIPGLPPFTGGAVGYASYDVVSEVEPTVPRAEEDVLGTPDALFMITDSILVFDRVRHTIKIIVQAHVGGEDDADTAYDKAAAQIEEIKERLQRPAIFPPVDLDETAAEMDFQSNKTREEFHEMVNTAKRYIYDGDIIQAVLSQRLSARIDASPLSVHRALRMLNPSPYMFLLDCKDFALVGASPEVHAKCIDRNITVRPIAGTRKRGATAEADDALAIELLADPKERAEHIMLVDLGRNDVGRISEPGSVSVDELMTIERYSHVMHIVSNVTGRLASGLDADAVMRSTFPAGTLSGAPKIRAMQIINELEQSCRGPYGGAVCYYSFGENVNSCITIRTALLKDGMAYVQAGAGIVADSDPESEYQETLSKATAMMKSLSMSAKFALPK